MSTEGLPATCGKGTPIMSFAVSERKIPTITHNVPQSSALSTSTGSTNKNWPVLKLIRTSCKKRGLFSAFVAALFAFGAPLVSGSEITNAPLPADVTKLLNSNCYDCHDADTMKGKIQLDNLGQLKLEERLDLLNRVQEHRMLGQVSASPRVPMVYIVSC